MSWLAGSILRGKTTNVSAPLRPCDAPVPRVGQERPGQSPPRRRKLARPQHNQEQEDGQFEEYEQQQQQEPHQQQQQQGEHQQKGDTPYAQRKTVLDEHWRSLNPFMRQSYINNAPHLLQCHVERGQLLQTHIQAQLNCVSNNCSCAAADSMLVPKEPLPAEYVSLDYRVPVSIPRWQCTACKLTVMPDYIRVGCFPSTPQRPSLLFSHTVMKHLTVAQNGGLSMTDVIEALEAAHQPYTLYPAADRQGAVRITSDMLTDAHCNWRRVTHRVTHLDSLLPGYQLPGGHFADCPCCAGSGEDEDYKLCLCGDAVTKLSGYSGVGQATTAIQPHLNSHLDCKPPPLPNHSGGLEYDVQHRFKAGTLSLPHLLGTAASGPDDTEQADCSSSLSCSRPEVSNKSGPVSIFGLVGFCCCHGVPALGLFCNMPTPEQFAFYLLALTVIMAGGSCKNIDFFIDFGCRLKTTWARYVDAGGKPSSWKAVRIMVNWMHGASHNQRCQVQNNGRHQPGSGWRYGEQCEQLWSMLKAIAGLTRYMSLAHRADVLQSRLSQIAFQKSVGLLDLLDKTWKEMKVKSGKVQRELEQLKLVAQQAGVVDGKKASEAYKASCLPASPSIGAHDIHAWKREYVELVLQEAAWLAMDGQAVAPAGQAVQLPSLSPTITQLLYCKNWQLKTFKNKLQRLELVNRIDAEAGISQSDMECGLHLLKIEKISGCQFHIESLVAEARQLQLERDREGTACKETRRKAKAQARKLLQAKEELLSMAEWQVLGTSQQAASVRIPETVISSMVSGSAPPWAEDAASSMASTLHHGKRYFQLYSDQERIAEQQVILRQELRRFQAWLRSMLEACTRSSAELNPGQRFYVEQHKAWFASKLEHAYQSQWEA